MYNSKAEHDELCCVYAGLLLFDAGKEITSDNIQKIIKSSGNQVDTYYSEFFANYITKIDINSMINPPPQDFCKDNIIEKKKVPQCTYHSKPEEVEVCASYEMGINDLFWNIAYGKFHS